MWRVGDSYNRTLEALSSFSDIAEPIFWFTTATLAYIYFGYPLLLAAIAWFRRPPRRVPGFYPRITVLIPAFNEEVHIHRKIGETLALEYPPDLLDVLVVSDGSTDRTEEIVTSFNHPRVKLLRVEGRCGKTSAQNKGVERCPGDVVVFSDATAIYHPKALLYLACHYVDPTVGAVSGRYQYFDPGGTSPTGLGSITFWNYENLIKKLQSRIRTLTGCSGCIYSVRKSVYTPLVDTACSDLVEPLCVVRKGYRVVFEDRALAYEETTKSNHEEFAMRVRVCTHGISALLSAGDMLAPWKDAWIAFQLISHKLLRWLVPFLLMIILLSTLVVAQKPLFRVLLWCQVSFYLLGLISLFVPLHRSGIKILGMPLYFCTVHAAVLFGLVGVFRGNRVTVWSTVRTH